jgi:hypothetical protein
MTTTTQTWPDNVTARIVTRLGIHTHNLQATVDIHDDTPGPEARSTARCQACGRTHFEGLNYRHHVLEWAQTHADQCTALPKPTDHNPPTVQAAIRHSA